jgi:hypothetical protein
MARCAPDSSRKISRRGSTRRIHLKNAARFAATSGRSHSLGRGRFFSTRTHRGAARPMLVGVFRCARATRRLYSQHNSGSVLSGASPTTRRNL